MMNLQQTVSRFAVHVAIVFMSNGLEFCTIKFSSHIKETRIEVCFTHTHTILRPVFILKANLKPFSITYSQDHYYKPSVLLMLALLEHNNRNRIQD